MLSDNNDYIAINQTSWNNKVATHLDSEFYDVAGFKAGASSLNDIELALLGDVKGKKILHLQCHFGQDTLSLARLGAKVTGIDLSDQAILNARKLASELNLEATFICCPLYDLPQHLSETFDLVFTSYGTIGWLPDLGLWAQIINQYLKPHGKFVFVEFHPLVWMFDDDFTYIKYRYFKSEPIQESENGSYADQHAPITQTFITWNHSLSETINSLIANNLKIDSFDEFDYSPYNCFKNMETIAPKKYVIKNLAQKIPLVFSLTATKC
jgi:SAM-dependent methyltransferase